MLSNPSSPRALLAKNAAYLASARLLPRFLRVIYVIVLARYLGPELYGLFAYGQSYYLSILPITMFGLQIRLTKDIGISRENATAIMARTLAFQTGVAIAAALVSIGAAQLIEANVTVRHLLLVFSLAMLARAIVNWTQHVFVAFESTHYALKFEVFFRPIEIMIGLLVVLAGGRLLAVATVHALIWWAHVIAALVVIHRHLAPVAFHCSWDDARALFRFGWPLSLNVFCSGFLLQGPIVLYRQLVPHALHIGQIAVVFQALTILCILPAAITASSLPALARSVHRQDGHYLRFTRNMMRFGYGFGAIAGLIGLTLGSMVIPGVLGADYAFAGALFGPAVWLVIPYTCGSMLASILMIQERTRVVLVCSGCGVIAMALAMPISALWFEAFGVLVSTTVGLLCWTLTLIATCWLTGERQLAGSFIRPTFWVAVSLAAFEATTPIHPCFAFVISLCVLGITAPLFGMVTSHEKATVRMHVRRYLRI